MNNTLISYISAFLVGGVICSLGQILIDKTKLTPARILVLFVTVGVFLTALGLYQKVVDIGGAGATIPLTGFGYSLAKGTFSDVDKHGLLGAFTGGIRATAGGVSAAIVFGYLVAVIFKPKAKA
ncbi:MAG: stage V sporulation protein AE [Clostridiaceae bacterium]|jgi:stage V sporulation protein AE|nr:stage V sporulation protein AE [Clostridiaceae bacterium]